MGAEKNITKRGFTITECLIALAVTGLLLAGLAVAIKASFMNYDQNRDFYDVVNKARQAMARITTQVRTGLVDPNDAVSEDRCILLCDDGSVVTYQYDSDEDKLYLQEQSTGNEYILCDNVTAMRFVKDNNTSTGDIRAVHISMTVTDGNIEWTVSDAAVPRKTLE